MKHYDDRLEHGKLIEAGPLAEHLDDRAILWANREMTDGFVPLGKVPILANWHGVFASFDGKKAKPVDPMELAERLVTAGRWVRVDGGFQIHDYLEAQRSKAQILKDREDAAKRQKTHRDKAKRNGGSNADRNGVTSSVSDERHTVTSDVGSGSVTGALEVRGENKEQQQPETGLAA